jgi:hypothetical protein
VNKPKNRPFGGCAQPLRVDRLSVVGRGQLMEKDKETPRNDAGTDSRPVPHHNPGLTTADHYVEVGRVGISAEGF